MKKPHLVEVLKMEGCITEASCSLCGYLFLGTGKIGDSTDYDLAM